MYTEMALVNNYLYSGISNISSVCSVISNTVLFLFQYDGIILPGKK